MSNPGKIASGSAVRRSGYDLNKISTGTESHDICVRGIIESENEAALALSGPEIVVRTERYTAYHRAIRQRAASLASLKTSPARIASHAEDAGEIYVAIPAVRGRIIFQAEDSKRPASIRNVNEVGCGIIACGPAYK